MSAAIKHLKNVAHRSWRTLAVTLLLVSGLLVAGCTVHAHPRPVRPLPRGKVVVVKKAHVHTAACGHYRHRGKWYFVKGHVHSPGCGHVRVGGVWVLK